MSVAGIITDYKIADLFCGKRESYKMWRYFLSYYRHIYSPEYNLFDLFRSAYNFSQCVRHVDKTFHYLYHSSRAILTSPFTGTILACLGKFILWKCSIVLRRFMLKGSRPFQDERFLVYVLHARIRGSTKAKFSRFLNSYGLLLFADVNLACRML